MKAKESNQNYPSRVREMSNYALREVKRVCVNVGERPAGEENEKKAQEYIAENMKKVSDSVETQEFEARPKIRANATKCSGILALAGALILAVCSLNLLGDHNSILAWVSAVLTVLALAIVIDISNIGVGVFAFLAPKQISSNVICTRNAGGETKRKIIFVGNVDSSYEHKFAKKGGIKKANSVSTCGVFVICIDLILAIASTTNIPDGLRYAVLAVSVLSIIPIVMFMLSINSKQSLMSAGNNLSGVFSSMAVIHYMDYNDVRFENTEVTAVSLGCGKSGNKGAEFFAKSRKGETVETVVIAVDSLQKFDNLTVYTEDGFKNDPRACALLKKASENAGFDIPYSKNKLDTTSAYTLFKNGLPATALAAADTKTYNTQNDKPEKLELKAIEAGINILLETAFLFDEQGLKDEY